MIESAPTTTKSIGTITVMKSTTAHQLVMIPQMPKHNRQMPKKMFNTSTS